MTVRPARIAVFALAACACAFGTLRAMPPAAADVLELSDGTKLDGKVLQEKDGFLVVRTLTETRRIAVADVKSRTPGEAPVEAYARLKSKADKEPRNADALWALYEFCRDHAEESKDLARDAKALPARILKVAPDHEQAHDAIGEVRFEGAWVRKEDVERLQAESARRKKQDEWQKRLGVVVELCEGQHWTLVDNTGAKDLPKKVKELDDMYRLLCETLGVERFWDGPATAVAFKRHEDYVRYLDEAWKPKIAGWRYEAARHPQNAGLWLNDPVPFQVRAVPEAKINPEEGMWAAFAHNSVHVALWVHKRGAPPAWFEEGLASVLEAELRGAQKAYCVGTQKADRNKTTDRPDAGKSGNSALAGEQAVFREHCRRAIEDEEFPEMRKFLKMKLGDFGPAEAGGAIGLVTYLRGKDPEKFKEYWAAVRAGAVEDQPWEKVWGWKSIEEMDKDWRNWVRSEW